QLTFGKGEIKEVSGLSVTFVDFDFSDAEKGNMVTGGGFKIGAYFDVAKDGKTERVELFMKNKQGEITFEPATSTLSPAEFTIVRLQPNREDKSKSKIEIAVNDPSNPSGPKVETLVIEASVKPFINLVWMGTVTLLIGFIVTIVRRVHVANQRI